jgi:hypothetical protein
MEGGDYPAAVNDAVGAQVAPFFSVPKVSLKTAVFATGFVVSYPIIKDVISAAARPVAIDVATRTIKAALSLGCAAHQRSIFPLSASIQCFHCI